MDLCCDSGVRCTRHEVIDDWRLLIAGLLILPFFENHQSSIRALSTCSQQLVPDLAYPSNADVPVGLAFRTTWRSEIPGYPGGTSLTSKFFDYNLDVDVRKSNSR